MATSIRELVMQDVVATLANLASIKGAIDCRPFDYETPPQPVAGNGVSDHPFAYAYEEEERPEDYSTELLKCELPVTTETTFRYDRTDPTLSLEREGRRLLAEQQAGMVVDIRRSGYAVDTREVANVISETPTDQIGALVTQWNVTYIRDRTDPTRQVTE